MSDKELPPEQEDSVDYDGDSSFLTLIYHPCVYLSLDLFKALLFILILTYLVPVSEFTREFFYETFNEMKGLELEEIRAQLR
jgi:hypothetical protein